MIPRPGVEPDRSHRFTRLAGPAVIALAALCMLCWSWGTWPDPLVDYGTHLYVPWQLSLGKVLYRDIAYYNGPFSPYFNSLMFRIAGVSIRTLVAVNLLILAGVMILAYRLTRRAGGKAAAIFGGVTFALVFGFGQIVPIGNYNWVTPYAHELTHGTALGLVAIACINHYQRKGGILWIAAAGAAAGCVFLTKAEPTAALLPALAIQLLAGWRGDRAAPATITKTAAIFIGSFLIVPILAWMLLGMEMSPARALIGVLGSWPWVFDRRITSLVFYQNINGLNEIALNLLKMVRWCSVYLAFVGAAVCIALLVRFKRPRPAKLFAAKVGAIVFIGLFWQIHRIDWSGLLAPLPLFLLVILAALLWQTLRRKTAGERFALRLALVCFSLLLLIKMGLKPLAYHYGFVLAWTGTIVLIAAWADDLPAWIARQGGTAGVVRAAGFGVWAVAVLALLQRDAANFDSKRWMMAPGTPDQFAIGTQGLEVQKVCDEIRQLIPENGTVVVFPQGLMINYLTRRASPVPYVNFMPPEVLAVGEDSILRALNQHPPDLIVINSSSIQNNHFTLDGKDIYGEKTLAWIKHNYQLIDVVTLPKPLPTTDRFVICRRR